MKIFYLFITLCLGGLLSYSSLDMPLWGDIDSPANAHISTRFIEKAVEETEVPNLVTAILADYRGYDTFGETVVIFTGGIACLFILRQPKKRKESKRSFI